MIKRTLYFGNSAYLSSERPDRVGVFGEYRMDLGAYMDMGMQLSTTFVPRVVTVSGILT